MTITDLGVEHRFNLTDSQVNPSDGQVSDDEARSGLELADAALAQTSATTELVPTAEVDLPAGTAVAIGEMAVAEAHPTAAERLQRRRQQRALSADEARIGENQHLAEYLAGLFSHKGEPLEDLTQVAYVALIQAVRRFDPDRGFEFSTFAVPTILGNLKRHFRDKSWVLRVPRQLKDAHLLLNTVRPQLTQELNREPTIAEMMEATALDEETVREALVVGQTYHLPSLNQPVSHYVEETAEVGDMVADPLAVVEDGLAERSEIGDLLGCLDDRLREIVTLRFYDELTQSQIAERVGISQMHVSRLLIKAFEQMREYAAQPAP